MTRRVRALLLATSTGGSGGSGTNVVALVVGLAGAAIGVPVVRRSLRR